MAQQGSDARAAYAAMGTNASDCIHRLTIAPPPWSLKAGQSWTNEMRQAQIERPKAALPLENQALQEIADAHKTVES
jgi:hypothetical protein